MKCLSDARVVGRRWTEWFDVDGPGSGYLHGGNCKRPRDADSFRPTPDSTPPYTSRRSALHQPALHPSPACGGRCPQGGWGQHTNPPTPERRPDQRNNASQALRTTPDSTPPYTSRRSALPPPAGEGARRADGGSERTPPPQNRPRVTAIHQLQPAAPESRHRADHPIDCTTSAARRLSENLTARATDRRHNAPHRTALREKANQSIDLASCNNADSTANAPSRPCNFLRRKPSTAFWHAACISSGETAHSLIGAGRAAGLGTTERDRQLMTLATHPHFSRTRPASGGSRSWRHFA
ncbi:hypothetical protein GGR62_002991 [Xanthomonas campestris]|nr:hypothetical protein [Xanthomonas sp. 3075]